MARWQYQVSAEPVLTITPPAAPDLSFIPENEVPRRKPTERLFAGGQTDNAWFLSIAPVVSIPWMPQVPDPPRRKPLFHPSLYVSETQFFPITAFTIDPFTIPSTATVSALSAFLRGGATGQLFIGGVEFFWHESTFQITKTLSGGWTASFDLDYYGGARPVVGQEVLMYWQTVKRWGGYIQTVAEVGTQGGVSYSTLKINCGGYQLLTDRVIIAKLFTLFLGGTSGITVYNIWQEKLTQFGVTKIGDLPANVIGEQLFHYITVTEAFNRIKAQDPGYDWWIDDDKLLHYELTSPSIGANAPFTIRNGDTNADFMTVSISDVRFRNKQWVLPSASIIALRDDSFTGDGVTTAFATQYNLNSKPIVRVGGVAQIVTAVGVWDPGWQFYYVPGGIGVFAGVAPGVGVSVDILYPNPFPVAFSAEDDASIAAVGLYEAVWQSKNVFDGVTAAAEAEGLLDLYSDGGFPTAIEFVYNSIRQSAWLLPGMVVDVSRTFPTASGNFTVEQVSSQEIELTVWKHTVRLRAGLGDVTDAQALQAFRTSARVPINSPPYRLTGNLFEDLLGITNPGASTGAIKTTFVVQVAGVIASWDILFADDPPTGADMQIDALLNGVTIFPAGAANKIVAKAGVTTLQSGINFAVVNTPVAIGDVITLNVLQVGSINKGKNCTLHIDILVPANAA